MSKEQNTQQQVQFQKTYVKDISFESPQSPDVFTQQISWEPENHIEAVTKFTALKNNHYEINLMITLTAKQSNKIVYIVEVQQAGLFLLEGFNEQSLDKVIHTYCPNVLFPFINESISNLILKGGFPSFVLAPINFDAMYIQEDKK